MAHRDVLVLLICLVGCRGQAPVEKEKPAPVAAVSEPRADASKPSPQDQKASPPAAPVGRISNPSHSADQAPRPQETKPAPKAHKPKPPPAKVTPEIEADAVKVHNLGVRAYNDNSLEEALGHFTKALAIHPGYAPALEARKQVLEALATDAYNLAVRAFNADRPQEALAHCNKAIAVHADFAPAYRLRSDVYVELQKPKEAVEDAFRGLKLDPEDSKSRANLYRLALGPLKDLFPPAPRKSSTDDPREKGKASEKEVFKPAEDFEEQVLFPAVPGTPAEPLQPLGGLFVNVLRYAVVDEKAGTLTLVGSYEPRYPTGSVPYWEFLQTGWSHAKPWVDLRTPDAEFERIDRVLTKTWFEETLREAGKQATNPEVALMVQANFGWGLEEAALRTARLAGRSGEAAQLAEMKDFFHKSVPLFEKGGFWLTPGFLTKFGGLVPKTPVKFGGLPADSQLARVLFQADFCLKQSDNWVPLERHVSGYLTWAHFCRKRGVELPPVNIVISTLKAGKIRLDIARNDGKLFVNFAETCINLHMKPGAGESPELGAACQEYARLFEAKYDGLAQWFPVYHELREAVKVLALAHFLKQQGVALSFPKETWNPWQGLDVVDGFLTVTIHPTGPRAFRSVHRIEGGVDLGSLGNQIVAVEKGTGPVPVPVRDLDATVPFLRHTLPADGILQAGTAPLSMDQRATTQLAALTGTDPEALRLRLAGLRDGLKKNQEALMRLGRTNPADAQEVAQWQKAVQDAQRAAMSRYLDASFSYIGSQYLGWLRRTETETAAQIRPLLDQIINTDPRERERLRIGFYWLARNRESMRRFHRMWIERAEQWKNLIEGADATATGIDPNTDLETKLKQIQALLEMLPGGPAGSAVRLLVETGYDLTAIGHAWARIRQLNRNSEEYLRAVEALHERMKSLVKQIHEVERRLEELATPSPVTDLRSLERHRPVDAPVTATPANRSKDVLDRVINQFDVENNPRYQPGAFTWCNIFVSDVTRALGAEMPHWINRQEQTADRMIRWLHDHGAARGWRRATAQEAQAHANQGKPAIVGGFAHIAVVRPGRLERDLYPAIAQAGRTNYSASHVNLGWLPGQRDRVEYWVHD